jgi:hypothetical protein
MGAMGAMGANELFQVAVQTAAGKFRYCGGDWENQNARQSQSRRMRLGAGRARCNCLQPGCFWGRPRAGKGEQGTHIRRNLGIWTMQETLDARNWPRPPVVGISSELRLRISWKKWHSPAASRPAIPRLGRVSERDMPLARAVCQKRRDSPPFHESWCAFPGKHSRTDLKIGNLFGTVSLESHVPHPCLPSQCHRPPTHHPPPTTPAQFQADIRHLRWSSVANISLIPWLCPSNNCANRPGHEPSRAFI